MTADNTQGTITCAIGYIDRFLEFQGVEERFSTLTDDNLEGDHFIHSPVEQSYRLICHYSVPCQIYICVYGPVGQRCYIQMHEDHISQKVS